MSGLTFARATVASDQNDAFARAGSNAGKVMGALLRQNRHDFGSRVAVLDGDVTITWADLVDAASRFAGFLNQHGIGHGDVVTWQLPNWWESVVVGHGIWAAGAISNPIVPMYREHEIREILAGIQPRCVVTAASFRQHKFAEMWSDVCASVFATPPLRIAIRGAVPGWIDFETAMRGPSWLDDAVDPDDPALVVLTSGTTSGAKAVVHSTRSALSIPERFWRWNSYGWEDRAYVAAPLGHVGSIASTLTIPAVTGSSVVLRDRWDAAQAVSDMVELGVTYAGGAPVFVREILDALAARRMDRLPLRIGYYCGAAGIPPSLAAEAEAAGMRPNRSYGMSECPYVSASLPFDDPHARITTDGRVLPGGEVRVLDENGTDLTAGEVGEILVRGPQRALGYLDEAQTRDGFTSDGWFRSGDLGSVSDAGFLTISGRLKEIINRGGEKLSAREIEEAIMGYPGIIEAVVVPAPHERLGEQPAAFVRGPEAVAFDDVQRFLLETGLAPQKVPRVWRQLSDFSRNHTGKVRRQQLQDSVSGDPRIDETEPGVN